MNKVLNVQQIVAKFSSLLLVRMMNEALRMIEFHINMISDQHQLILKLVLTQLSYHSYMHVLCIN